MATPQSLRGKPGARTYRPLGPDHDDVGLAGERAFAERYGYLPDGNVWRHGDSGADFRTLHGTVDVKTYRKPGHLLVESGKARADIYVLARYNDRDGQATLLGWAVKIEVEAAPVSDIGGMGVQSHAIPVADLHSLAQLDATLGAWYADLLAESRRGKRLPLAVPVVAPVVRPRDPGVADPGMGHELGRAVETAEGLPQPRGRQVASVRETDRGVVGRDAGCAEGPPGSSGELAEAPDGEPSGPVRRDPLERHAYVGDPVLPRDPRHDVHHAWDDM